MSPRFYYLPYFCGCRSSHFTMRKTPCCPPVFYLNAVRVPCAKHGVPCSPCYWRLGAESNRASVSCFGVCWSPRHIYRPVSRSPVPQMFGSAVSLIGYPLRTVCLRFLCTLPVTLLAPLSPYPSRLSVLISVAICLNCSAKL